MAKKQVYGNLIDLQIDSRENIQEEISTLTIRGKWNYENTLVDYSHINANQSTSTLKENKATRKQGNTDGRERQGEHQSSCDE